ncbi:MAG: acyl-CoA thioesterase II [Betaproteobacteria bacterium]
MTADPGASPDHPDALAHLLGLFDLAPLPAQPDGYVGQSLDLGFRNLFGGHILGQSLMAAGLTCGDRRAHSLHAYFLRGGDAQQPVHYQVDRIRDGNSFSVRRVTASQQGKAILILSTSFQVDEPGFEHQLAMPDVPPPDDLKAFKELARPRPDALAGGGDRKITSARAIEIRPVPMAAAPGAGRPGEPAQYVWLRAAGTVPDNAALHRSLLAYASDFALLSTAMLPHGVGYYTPGMVMASLDHAMWFYKDFRIDEWLLYAMDSPAAASSRGLSRGNIFRRDGTLVACVAQEGLMRMTAPAPGSTDG